MQTMKHITLSELNEKFNSLHLPSGTRLTVTIEDKEIKKPFDKQKGLEAMKKLKGSGNGNLVAALLKERRKDALHE